MRLPLLLFCLPVLSLASSTDWLQPGVDGNTFWGLKGGLHFAIPPGGFTPDGGGPRGLIRLGSPTLAGGKIDLINFIAIEPVVGEVRGYSELEKSQLDGRQGKLLWTGDAPPAQPDTATPAPGLITSPQPGIEEMTVTVHVEKFQNGAHVRLLLTQRSDAPDELRLTIQAEPDSAPLTRCILTATMGNKARARQLWLKDAPASSLQIFGAYTGDAFAPTVFFPLARLPRSTTGDVLVAFTNDEADPTTALEDANFWKYRGTKATQYWRKPAAQVDDSLRCAVNARYTYWMSKNPVPGGLAFENVELVQDFKPGQTVTFGITRRSPAELLK